MLAFILLALLTVILLAVALFLFLKNKSFAGGMTLIAVGLSGYISYVAMDTQVMPKVEEDRKIAEAEKQKKLERAKTLAAQGKSGGANVGIISGITAAELEKIDELTPQQKKEAQKLIRGLETGETFKDIDSQLSEMSKDMEQNSQPTMGTPTMPAAGR